MSVTEPFERLHPALQHHIVNTLGWSSLRPTQQEAIAPILAGDHCLLLAPTAGGKTEAALFPILSRMLSESWTGVSVLYVCPIRALLNNLEPRLTHYLGMVGRRVGLWHGDVTASAKARILGDPPDLLLTTPESIEGMLISRHEDRRRLLGDVRLMVVDELHAFGGDDRGWHVRALIQRLGMLNRRALQVVGLSATVGNPEALLRWLLVDRPGRVIGSSGVGAEADLTLDYVGSLTNAAEVIARLHPGEKRLVFCDSRGKVEALAAALREQGVRTFISHSSLSAQERRSAEAAFAGESDCVIVATSTLELGIDVGDLDRVIQIDAPATVSSFLQRMGRSGRREGARRNYLFLATQDEGFLLSAALMRLWGEGFVESVVAPPQPWHVLAQQAMAMVLQGRGLSRGRLLGDAARLFPELSDGPAGAIIDHMQAQGVLADTGGLLWIGEAGEREYGRRNFETLVSTFTSPMCFTVVCGRQEVGTVDPISVLPKEGALPVIVLGGRYWCVMTVDWPSRVVWVEPTEAPGRSSWLGTSRALSFAVCQAMKRVLIDGDVPGRLSKRSVQRLEGLRNTLDFLAEDASTVVEQPDGTVEWWTFAGAGANFVLRDALRGLGHPVRRMDDLSLRLDRWPEDLDGLRKWVATTAVSVPLEDDGLKFRACLPEAVRREVLGSRMVDRDGAIRVMEQALLRAFH